MKKLLSIILCVSMIFSMSAFALANEGQVITDDNVMIGDDVVIEDGAIIEEVTCSCGVAEGEAHLEGCGLYVEPEEPVCTCEAAEGEAHLEGCALYAEAEAPTVDILMCTCDAAEGEPHAETCVLYEVPAEVVVCEECGMSDAHAETCSQYEAPAPALFDVLMAAESVEEMYLAMLASMETQMDALMALTVDEIAALRARVEVLDPEADDVDTADLLDTLAFLPNGGEEMVGDAAAYATTSNSTWQGQRFTKNEVVELGNGAVITMRKLDANELENRQKNANYVIPNGVTVTFKGYGSFARANDNKLALVYVEKGGKLIIEGTSIEKPFIIDGNNVIATSALIICEGELVCKNTVIQNGKNRSVNADGKPNAVGGGIYITTTGSLVMDNCIVTKNTSSLNGGGIECRNSMVITNSTISYNRAMSSETGSVNAGRGGGFNLVGSNPSATSEGRVATAVLTNVTITENAAMYYGGGGQISSNAHLTMNEGTVFSNNEALLHGAAGLHVTSNSVFTMNGGKFENNTAQTVGGAIHSSYTCTLNLNAGEILNNTANGRGGGVHINTGGALTLNENIVISGNTANNQPTGSASTVDATGDNWSNLKFEGTHINNGYGGGVLIDSGTCTVSGATITDNHAAVDGGGVALVMLNVSDSGLSHVLPVNFTMTSGEISGNTTDGNGAGVFLMSNKAKENIIKAYGDETTEKYQDAILKLKSPDILTAIPEANISGGTVSNNVADNNGGGLYLGENTKFIISGTGKITSNGAVDGAGVYIASGAAEINGGTISSNKASNDGGAVYVQGTVTMTNGNVASNTAADSGGAMYVTGKNASVEVLGGSLTSNTAVTAGGAVYVDGGNFTMVSGTMTGNSATAKESFGGGVAVIGGNIYIGASGCEYTETNHNNSAHNDKKHPVIENNTAVDSGGGIALIGEGDIVMYCGKIAGNMATNRGRGYNIYMEKGTFNYHTGDLGNPELGEPELVIVGGELKQLGVSESVKLMYYHCNVLNPADGHTHTVNSLAVMHAIAAKNSIIHLPDGEKYWSAPEGTRFSGWTFYGPDNPAAQNQVRSKADYMPIGVPIEVKDEIDGSIDENNPAIHMYALWVPDQSNITYKGSVVNGVYEEETLSMNGNPATYDFEVGSNYVKLNAPVKAGYTFVGWYIYQDLNQNANWGYEPVYKNGAAAGDYDDLDYAALEANGQFVTAAVDGTCQIDMGDTLFGDITMIAKFEPAYGDLTIVKSVNAEALNLDPNQTFMIRIAGQPDNTALPYVDMVVAVLGDGRITVKELPVGTYTVSELTDWSWRYNFTSIEDTMQTVSNVTANSGKIVLTPDDNTVTVTNARTANDNWMDGSSYTQNIIFADKITRYDAVLNRKTKIES